MVANYGTAMSNYRNMVQFGDMLEDSSLGLSSFGGNLAYNPLSMSGSILSPGILGGGNYSSGAGDQAYYNMDAKGRLAYDTDYAKQQMLNQLDLDKTKRSLILQSTATEDAGTSAAAKLHDLAVGDRQDQISGGYANLLKAAREQLEEGGGKATDQQVKDRAEKIYFAATGQRLTDDIEQHGTPQFLHGLIQGTGLGALIIDNRTAKDNAAEINSQPVSKGDQFANIAGIVVGALATAGIAFALIRHGGNPFKAIANGFKTLGLNNAEKLISKAKILNPESPDIAKMEEAFSKSKNSFAESKALSAIEKAGKELRRIHL